jgi:CHASE2 domain-containing sensor protein
MKIALFHTILSFIVIWLLAFVFFNLSVFDPVSDAFKDFSYLDLYESKRMYPERTINEDIAIVNIEHLDREELGFLIDKIAIQNPKIIGLDVVFDGNRGARGDSTLNSSIEKHEKLIISAYKIENNTVTKSLEKFRANTSGLANFDFEGQQDNVIRSFLGYQNEDTLFSVSVANKYKPKGFKKDFTKPLPIKYIGDYNQFWTLNHIDCMIQDSLPVLKNKIVLLGYLGMPLNNKHDVEDKHYTPMNESISGKALPDTYGVVIHANIIRMILENDYIKTIPNVLKYVLAFVITFLTSLVFIPYCRKNRPWSSVLTKLYQLFFTIALLWVSLQLYKANIKLPVVFIIAVSVLSIELIPYSEHVNNYLTKRFKWKKVY